MFFWTKYKIFHSLNNWLMDILQQEMLTYISQAQTPFYCLENWLPC